MPDSRVGFVKASLARGEFFLCRECDDVFSVVKCFDIDAQRDKVTYLCELVCGHKRLIEKAVQRGPKNLAEWEAAQERAKAARAN